MMGMCAWLQEGISNMFEQAGCGTPAVRSLLGEEGVSEGNMMQYLGILEQRTNEILQVSVSVNTSVSISISVSVSISVSISTSVSTSVSVNVIRKEASLKAPCRERKKSYLFPTTHQRGRAFLGKPWRPATD